jgi:excisionase family DNA binding protein
VTKAARLLGVHPNTIRAWSDQGRLRYYRINPRGDRRYRLGDLQRFMDAAEGADRPGRQRRPRPDRPLVGRRPQRGPRAIASSEPAARRRSSQILPARRRPTSPG